ncbi:DoxX family membrane protein [Halostagnicola kamekurae]|uniref:Thiosulfate dehydrogenase [quinone] large subunit n=1 Tax=Halostagnicola kamekurae TaxID=619731 RepID=A0A1I6P0Q3_9EURY|nr:DoxX family membrane protein [Halostagnicola kamekurae]SFS33794.1 thiosulfate dehydrogenase [quinone] large subunit [Halostagnicola kamekurae]
MTDTSANRLESTLGGIRLEGRPHQLGVWAIVGLRLVMGWVMLSAGWGKFTSDFSAYGYLSNVDPASPASGIFGAMAENASMMAAVDVIVPATQILIGLALLAGLFVRLAALGAATQMVLFYLGSWDVAGGAVNDQFVYAAVFLALGAFAAGRVLGADRYLEEHSLVERFPSLRYVLG